MTIPKTMAATWPPAVRCTLEAIVEVGTLVDVQFDLGPNVENLVHRVAKDGLEQRKAKFAGERLPVADTMSRMPRATRYGASSPAPTRRSSTSRSRRRLPTSSCPATAIAVTTVETTMARSRRRPADQTSAIASFRVVPTDGFASRSPAHETIESRAAFEPDAIPAEAPAPSLDLAPRMRPGSVSTDTIVDARPCHPRRRRSSVGRRRPADVWRRGGLRSVLEPP